LDGYRGSCGRADRIRFDESGVRSAHVLRLEHRHISAARDRNAQRLVRSLLLKVQFETLPEPTRLTADDTIHSRVIISRTTEDRLANLLLVYLSLATL
jgi:hypothetical protein